MPRKGGTHTSEARKKISLSKIGDKNPAKRVEVRAKIGDTQRGKKHTEEHNQNISQGNRKRYERKGEREKTSKSQSKAMKKRWENLEYRKQKSEQQSRIMKDLYQQGGKMGFPKGENHPNWVDGQTILYSEDWNNTLREAIRQRDDYVCQECGIHQDEIGWKLDIHHIDYDKKNCNPENLISLCRSCHLKTNHNRDYWENYFLSLISSQNEKA